MAVEVQTYTQALGYESLTQSCTDVIIWPPGIEVPVATETMTKEAGQGTYAVGQIVTGAATASGEQWRALETFTISSQTSIIHTPWRSLATVVSDGGGTFIAQRWKMKPTGTKPGRGEIRRFDQFPGIYQGLRTFGAPPIDDVLTMRGRIGVEYVNGASSSTYILGDGTRQYWSEWDRYGPGNILRHQSGVAVVRPIMTTMEESEPPSGLMPVTIRGCQCEVIAIWQTGATAGPSGTVYALTQYRLIAPCLPSITPYLAIDCKLPSPWLVTSRVIWIDGFPRLYCRTPSVNTVRRAVALTHADYWSYSDGASASTKAWFSERPREHHTLQYSCAPAIQSSYTGRSPGLRGVETPGAVFRPQIFLNVPAYDTDAVAPFTQHPRRDITVRGRWRMANHSDIVLYTVQPDGTPLTGWQSLSWTTPNPTTDLIITVIVDPTTLTPPEPTGLIPRSLVFEVELTSLYSDLIYNFMTSTFISVQEIYVTGNSRFWTNPQDIILTNGFEIVAISNPPAFPWDVPILELAPADADCAYVANAGYAYPAHGAFPSDTVITPVVTRAGNLITIDTATPDLITADMSLMNRSQMAADGWIRAVCTVTKEEWYRRISGTFQSDTIAGPYHAAWIIFGGNITLSAAASSQPIQLEFFANFHRGSGFGGDVRETKKWVFNL